MKNFYAILLSLIISTSCCLSQTLDKKYYITDRAVTDIVQHGNTIYLGGNFTIIGPNTGHAALLDNATGIWDDKMPGINGEVDAIAADGSGGWFIGGVFDHADDEPVGNLIHIKADKSLDKAFAPKPNYAVKSLVVYNGTLYVGGNFTTILGQTRQHAASINITTGTLTNWNPQPDGFVSKMIASKGNIYMLGNFFNVNGQQRTNVASVNAVTAAVNVLSITQNSSSGIGGMTLRGDTIYIGGNFLKVNGVARTELAAVDVNTNITTSWAPTADNAISDLHTVGNKIIVTGAFDIANGASHLGLAAFDAITGQVSPWNANIIGYNAVGGNIASMANIGDTLYMAGHFKSVNGQLRNNLAAINVNTGQTTNWDPQANADAYVIASNGIKLYAAGIFTSVNTVNRSYVAALDAKTGKVTPWAPQLDGSVHGMAVKGDTIYIGGEFFKIGDSSRNWLASIDSTTGKATAWNPHLFGRAYAIDIAGDVVYVSGNFSIINGADRYDIAALDANTAAVAPLSVDVNQSLNTLIKGIKISGKTLYMWGAFKSIGADTRNNIAAIDINTGKATAWNPDANSTVFALTLSGSTVYAGGAFSTIGGQNRSGIAQLDNVSGKATGFNPGVSGAYVGAVAVANNIVYAGGSFSSAGGKTRNNIAAFNASTGTVTGWHPNTNYSPINAIIPFGSKLLIGGNFTQFAYYSASNLAVAGQEITLPLQLLSFTASAHSNTAIQLNWATANEINTANFTLQRANDGVNFTDITSLPADGKIYNVYSYNDAAFKTGGTLYYRLKMADKDGAVTYSNTISIKLNYSAKDFIVYPNPAHDQIALNVTTTTSQKAVLIITDMAGKTVQQQFIQLNQGNNNISVTLKASAKGDYVAELRMADKTLSSNFLIY